ncbi:MAG TPA: hypothetical protein VMW61_01080 [Dehalococcoidales bacterium]|nr:hypothetical protein [Dehalococcoidales bacterium]
MAETDELFTAIKRIQGRINSIDFTLEQVLACLPQEQLWEKIKPVLSKTNAKRIFLTLDTPRSQSEIMEQLAEDGEPISQPTVSRCLTRLMELGLVKIVDVQERENIYAKTRMDKLLGITQRL